MRSARDTGRPRAFQQAAVTVDGSEERVEVGASKWQDRHVLDKHGELLGMVIDVYPGPTSRRPEWLAVSTGYFGTRIVTVPLRGASLLGDDIVVRHDRSTVSDAPDVEIVSIVDPLQHRLLVDHYARSESAEPLASPEYQERSI
jgi:sporulation protein YlmC with PRC-barrel domain